MEELEAVLPSEKDKKIIEQRLVYLDHLFTNAVREFGYNQWLEYYLLDLLSQMVTLANAIGINIVTIKDLEHICKRCSSEKYIPELALIRMKIYNLRAKLISECVRQGVIESFKEIPIAIAEKEEVESYEQ